jgi:mRNA-degrading endonuclease YafQ of YafQ-DinJ toxin-antitoxin module
MMWKTIRIYIVIIMIEKDEIYFVRTGTHSDLFK